MVVKLQDTIIRLPTVNQTYFSYDFSKILKTFQAVLSLVNCILQRNIQGDKKIYLLEKLENF